VNYDNSLVVTITVTRYLWVPSSGDHFIYMWRHLQAATGTSAICALSHLMCAWKYCYIKLSLYYWTHWSCW